MDEDLTILGGGPAGLAVALYAYRAGRRFTLLERSAEVGGLCRTFADGRHRYDAGAHRFHDRDAEITADVRELLGEELASVDSPSQIFHRGRFVDFPPRPLGWILGEGIREGLAIAAELVRARLRPRPELTFEDYALNRFGRRLAGPLLLDYSEKLWGLPSRELAPDIATRRLSGLTFSSLIVEVLSPQRTSTHLDGEFLYPRSGYGAISARIAEELPAASVLTRCAVQGLDCEGGRVRALRVEGRPPLQVDGRVVSTLPLTVLVRLLGDALPAEVARLAAGLRFRDIRIVFLRLGVARCSHNATVYLPDPKLCVSRVSEPKNRSAAMSPADETSLVAEVPCFPGDAVHALDDAALAQRVIAELAGTGLIDASSVLGWKHHLLPHAYPVYALGYAETVARIRDAVGGIENLDLLGRGGAFWYSHLHDQMRVAKDYVGSSSALSARSPQSAEAAAQHVAAHSEIGGEAEPRVVSG